MRDKITKILNLCDTYPIRPLVALKKELTSSPAPAINRIKRCFIVAKNFKPGTEIGTKTLAELNQILPKYITELEKTQ